MGHMVIWWPKHYRIELVESILALANVDAIWNSKQEEMVRFRPTRRSSGRGKAAPVSFSLDK